EAVEELKAANEAALVVTRDAQETATKNAMLAVMIGLVSVLLLALAVGFGVTRAIVRPTLSMIGYMQKLMAGDTSIQIVGAERKDEFGKMGQAIVAFRDAAVEKIRIEAEAASTRSMSENERLANEAEKARIAEEDRVALTALADGLAAMSNGDLTHRFTAEVAPRAEQLKTDFNTAIAQLQQAMSVVLSNVAG
ncbi:MAG: HAMP domain-containing protein, partial [Candidatus Sericytochromatia bacterium]